jgi:hypothetical protein
MDTNPRRFVCFVVSLIALGTALSCAHAGDNSHASDQTQDDKPPAHTSHAPGQLSLAELEAKARSREVGDEDYPLNDYPREVSGDVECPEIDTIEYRGQVIAYNQPIEINPRFRKRLIRFETMVSELAVKLYGRAPSVLVHAGGHTCKTVGNRGEKLSEHGFGHAIDVMGFDFDAVSGQGEQVARAARAFSVRLEDHWGATEGFGAKHSLFLHLLTDALKERGPFSTMLGPAYPGHSKMFHFDFGPQFFFRI